MDRIEIAPTPPDSPAKKPGARIAFTFIVLLAAAGCTQPLYVQTAGTAGPLRWEAIDLVSGRRTVEGKEADAYRFTLVVRETLGIGLTFTKISSSVYGGGWVGYGRRNEKFELPPFCELRVPFLSTGFKSPLWFFTLTGNDERGHPIAIKITVALPPDPSPAIEPEFGETFVQRAGALADLSLAERRRLQVASITLSPADIAAFLAFDETHSVAPMPGATVNFDNRSPLAARRGLRSLADWLGSSLLPPNWTLAVPLNVPSRTDLPRAVRFTHIMREPRPNACAREILIDGAHDFVDFSLPRDLGVLTRHGFRLSNNWSDRERGALAAFLAHIPDRWFAQIEGLKFNRESGDSTTADASGYYNSAAHAITMYDLAFRPVDLGFAAADKTAGAIAHELGHAIDFIPLRRALERKRLALITFERSFARYRISGDADDFRIPPEHEKAWREQKRQLAELDQNIEAARSASGARWQFVPAKRLFEIVDGNDSAGSENEFRKAARTDGPVRITEYAEKSWSEYFAECFSLYVVDPQLLAWLRPNIYAYFTERFPR